MSQLPRVVLLTGASRGLGAALMQELLDRGVNKVYATCRQPEKQPQKDHRIQWRALDLACADSIESLAESTNDAEWLFNNAAINHRGHALQSDQTLIHEEMAVNCLGPLRLMQLMRPRLTRAEHGRIINILSICSFAGMPSLGGYCASKAALYSLCQSIAPALNQGGISLHNVFPGPIDTDMNADQEIPNMVSPESVATHIIDAVLNNQSLIYPDPQSQHDARIWLQDPLELQKQYQRY
ncbi:MAG: SDR family NAD(P)-dependent oxidoreductase [Pseudomonadota bacterium]